MQRQSLSQSLLQGPAILAAAVVLLLATAQAQSFNVLYRFTGGADGARPDSGVVMDAGGRLYGTAFVGGTGYGTVFSLKPQGTGWTLGVLYTFTGGSDGANPLSRVVFGPDGTLYGSTSAGGITTCSFEGLTGCGTVYKLRPPAFCRAILCPWTENILYSFTGGMDGWQPDGDPVFDASGNLYGITSDGGEFGTCNGRTGCGTVFELTRSNNWTESVLWNFGEGSDGVLPIAGVVFDAAGNLYGTTYLGGSSDVGIVYQLTPVGSGWNENILYNYTGGPDGANPYAGLLLDSVGNVYSTAYAGGAGGGGTVSELSPAGGGWTYTLLDAFSGMGGQRFGNLIMDQAGDLYGLTHEDGQFQLGSVFKLTPGNGGWTYSSLHDFTGGSDGAYPRGTLIFDSAGNLYGTAAEGGNTNDCSGAGCGVVWEITNP